MDHVKEAIAGIKWTTLSSLCNAALQLLLLLLMSQVFTPAQFGIYAIVNIVLAFSQNFIDAGISNALFTQKDFSRLQLSSLYWLNILTGWFLALVLFLIAPAVALFYHEKELLYLIRTGSILFVIMPPAMQFRYLLQKDFSFNFLAKAEISGTALYFCVASILILLKFGPISLLVALIARHLLEGTLLVFKGVSFHKPSLNFNYKAIKPFLRFGYFQMGEKMLDYLNQQMDVILIGKLLSVSELGYYAFAKNLVMRPLYIINPIITRITVPLFAKVNDQRLALRNMYLQTINLVSIINFPIYFLLLILAPSVIPAVFGIKWLPSILPLQILCFYAMIIAASNPVGGLFISRNRAELAFWWNFALMLLSTLILYVSGHWGAIGVASGLLILQIVVLLPAYHIVIKPLAKLRLKQYLKSIYQPFLLAGFPAIIPLVLNFLPWQGPTWFIPLAQFVLYSSFFLVYLYKSRPDMIEKIRIIVFKKAA